MTDFELQRGTSLTRWRPATDEFDEHGRTPPEPYVASHRAPTTGPMRAFFRIGSLAYADGRFVQGWSGLDEMFVLNLRGEAVDTLDIPVARRKGVPADLRERIDIERIPYREQLEESSRLRQLFPRPGGGFLFTHHDQTALQMEPMPVLTAKVWVGSPFARPLTGVCGHPRAARLRHSTDGNLPGRYAIRPGPAHRRFGEASDLDSDVLGLGRGVRLDEHTAWRVARQGGAGL